MARDLELDLVNGITVLDSQLRQNRYGCVQRPSLLHSSSFSKTCPPHSMQHTAAFRAVCKPLTSSMRDPSFLPSLSVSLSELLGSLENSLTEWGERELLFAGRSWTAHCAGRIVFSRCICKSAWWLGLFAWRSSLSPSDRTLFRPRHSGRGPVGLEREMTPRRSSFPRGSDVTYFHGNGQNLQFDWLILAQL